MEAVSFLALRPFGLPTSFPHSACLGPSAGDNLDVSDVAKRVPHLSCKGGRYYFRKRVPQALVPFLGKEVSQALGNVSKAQAEVQARELSHRYAAEFLRELHGRGLAENPPLPAPTNPRRVPSAEEVKQVARASARELLVQDEEVRIMGLRTDLGDWWLGSLSDLDTAVGAALSDGEMNGLWHRFIGDLSAHGMTMPEDPADRRRMLRMWAIEQARALQGITARNRGEPIETPPPIPAPSATNGAAAGRYMRDAFDAWKKAARRPEKTAGAFERHLTTFEEMSGNPELSTFRRADAVRFRDALQAWAVEQGKTAATADNVMTSIKALATVAHDREWLVGTPFARLTINQGGKKSEGREPWTREELVRLFDAPLFTDYALPSGNSIATKAGADAAYWVPLLAAYTGARPGELCQLWSDDLSESEGGLVVEFRENAERGQRLKNRGSWRAVPVHSELIRLGLKDYWQTVSANGPGPLFPALPTAGENGPAGQFGKWFGAFKKAQGFASSTKTLHSFRHTFITEMKFAGVSGALVRALSGHAGEDIGETTYAATIRREAERLRAEVEKLRYPGLKPVRVFKACASGGPGG